MANEIVMGVVSGSRDGKLIVVTTPTRCADPAVGEVYLGLVSGTHNGKPLVVISPQRCDSGELPVGQTYLGVVSGTHNGKLLVVVPCDGCDGVFSCDCDICCTLEATVQVADSGDPYSWSAATDTTLTCGGVLQTSGGYACLNDLDLETQVYVNITTTYAEKDTIGAPEAYDTGSASGTREVKTDIWASSDFEIDGETYRLSYWRCEGTVYQTSPTTATTPFCDTGWVLQHQASDINFGNFWETIAGYDIIDWLDLGPTSKLWMFDVSDDNPYSPNDCPDGYSYNSGDLNPSAGCNVRTAPYVGGSTDDEDACPVAVTHESWYRLIADPDIDSNRIKCAKLTIADVCE